MTQDAKLIALLVWLGWSGIENSGILIFPWSGYPPGPVIIGAKKEQLPQLTLDLMAQAEAKLTPEQRDDYYYTHLHEKHADHSWTVSASKGDRLDALLKTIGKFHD